MVNIFFLPAIPCALNPTDTRQALSHPRDDSATTEGQLVRTPACDCSPAVAFAPPPPTPKRWPSSSRNVRDPGDHNDSRASRSLASNGAVCRNSSSMPTLIAMVGSGSVIFQRLSTTPTTRRLDRNEGSAPLAKDWLLRTVRLCGTSAEVFLRGCVQ